MSKSLDTLWREWHLCSERAQVACDVWSRLYAAGCAHTSLRVATELRDELLTLSEQAHARYLDACAAPLQAVRK